MAEFGHDLQRCLAGEPIAARRASTLYVLRKVVARHRFASGLLLLVLLTITVSAVALGLLYGQAEHAARIAADERAEALRRSNYSNTVALAQSALERFNTISLHELFSACPADLRGWEWRILQRRATTPARSVRRPSRLHVRYVRTGRTAHRELGHGPHPAGLGRADRAPLGAMFTGAMLEAGEFYPDSRRIALAGRDGDVQVWDTDECELRLRIHAHDGWILSVACAPPDGRTLASGGHDEVVRLCDPTPAPLPVAHSWATRRLSAPWKYSRDGELLASGGTDHRVLVWEAHGALLLELTGHRDEVRGLAFAPDGRTLVSSSGDGVIYVWNVTTGQPEAHVRLRRRFRRPHRHQPRRTARRGQRVSRRAGVEPRDG